MASTVALERQHESDSGMSCDQSPSPPQASPALIKQEPRETPLDFSMKKTPAEAESGFRPVAHRSAFESLGGQLPIAFNPHMPHLSHTSLAGLNHFNPLLNPLLAASFLPSMGIHPHHPTASALNSGRSPADASSNSDTSSLGSLGMGESRMTSSQHKTTRPFKAYNPSDPLSALQIPTANSMFNSMRASTDVLLSQYRHIMQQQQQCSVARTRSVDSSSSSCESAAGPGCQTTSTTPSPSQQVTSTSHPHTDLVSPQRSVASSVIVKNESTSSSASSSSAASALTAPPRRKKEVVKDDAYWERRRKNNDAAKRSRDTRRVKEDEIAMRAALLEQENLRLRMELAQLKAETEKLRLMLMNS